jgi:CRP-like cAMP-binding protein
MITRYILNSHHA